MNSDDQCMVVNSEENRTPTSVDENANRPIAIAFPCETATNEVEFCIEHIENSAGNCATFDVADNISTPSESAPSVGAIRSGG
jgi:hypothetical protein